MHLFFIEIYLMYSVSGIAQSDSVMHTHTHIYMYTWASLVAQTVKNLPAVQETQVQSVGSEDPLEKGMATTLVFLPGQFHEQRSLVGYSPWSCKESDTTK